MSTIKTADKSNNEIGLQINQLSVMALAKLRAAESIITPGLLVNHSTGSGKTLIGLMILLAFWDKYWIDDKTKEKRMWAIILTSTRKNQREDNNIDKLAELCITYFSSFETTVYNEKRFGENENGNLQAKHCIFSEEFYKLYFKEKEGESEDDIKERKRFTDVDGLGHLGWVKLQLRMRLWQGLLDSFIGDGNGKTSKMVENFKNRRKTTNNVDKTLYLYSLLGKDLSFILYNDDRNPPKPDKIVAAVDCCDHYIQTKVNILLSVNDIRNKKHISVIKFLNFVKNETKYKFESVESFYKMKGRKTNNNIKEYLEAMKVEFKKTNPSLLIQNYLKTLTLNEQEKKNSEIGQENMALEIIKIFIDKLEKVGFKLSTVNQNENVNFEEPKINNENQEDEIKNDDDDDDDNENDEDDEDDDTQDGNEDILYLNVNNANQRQLQHCVFVLDEVQSFFDPPAKESKNHYAQCLKGLTHYRDPKTTWLVALTATPGSTPEEMATILNLISVIPYENKTKRNKNSKPNFERPPYPPKKDAFLSEFKKIDPFLISRVDFSGDTSRYPVLQMHQSNVYTNLISNENSCYNNIFLEEDEIFKQYLTSFESENSPCEDAWFTENTKKCGIKFVEYNGYYGVHKESDIRNKVKKLVENIEAAKSDFPIHKSQRLQFYRNLGVFIFKSQNEFMINEPSILTQVNFKKTLYAFIPSPKFIKILNSVLTSLTLKLPETLFATQYDKKEKEENELDKITAAKRIEEQTEERNLRHAQRSNPVVVNILKNDTKQANSDSISDSEEIGKDGKEIETHDKEIETNVKDKIIMNNKLKEKDINETEAITFTGKHYIYCSNKRAIQAFAYYLNFYSNGLLQPLNKDMTLLDILEEKKNGVRFFYFANDVTNTPFNIVTKQGSNSLANVLAAANTTYEKYLKQFESTNNEELIKKIKSLVNEKELNKAMNRNGDLVPIILACGEAFKGVDLKGVTDIHVMDSFLDMQDLIQLIGRGPRMYSHSNMEERYQHVNVNLYFSKIESFNDGRENSDIWLYEKSKKEYKNFLQPINLLLKEKAWDNQSFINLHNKIGMDDFIDRLLNIDPKEKFGGITPQDEMKEYINNTKRNAITNKTLTIDDNNFDILKRKYIETIFKNDYRTNTTKKAIKKSFETYLHASNPNPNPNPNPNRETIH